MKKHVVSTYERAGRQVKSHTRGGKKPQRTAAKTGRVAPPAAVYDIANDDVYAELQGTEVPMEQPETKPAEQPQGPATCAQIAVLAILTLVAMAIAVGAYAVIYTALTKIYPGIQGALRALVPLGLEMIAAYVLHKLVNSKRHVLAFIAAAVILGCGWIEVDAAQQAPAAASRSQQEDILGEAAAQQHKEIKLPEGTGHEGPKGSKGLHDAQGAVLALQKDRDTAAQDILNKRLTLAKDVPPGEGRLSIELALAGALGSSSVLPLLEALLLAIGRRRKG